MTGEAPYAQVLTHGFTVDEKGMKMSKSRGNVVAPQEVIKTLGADILRLWVASTDYRGEIGVSGQILTRTADAYRRIRNTARFLLANLHGFEPEANLVDPAEMIELDRWAVDRALQLQAQVLAAYRDYQFHLIYQKIHNFCVVELGGFYLDVIKDRQYTTQWDSLARRSAQTAMYHIVEALTRWLAPILSFTADEIWQHIPGARSESVFLEGWYPGLFAIDTEDRFDRSFWERVIATRTAIGKELERLRADGAIGSNLAAEVDLYCGPALQQVLSRLGDELRFLTITSEVRLHPERERPPEAVAAAGQDLWILVRPSPHPKCTRCWHHRADVGANAEHPQLCGRCVGNLDGPGETRRYA
jgi:isoleucyl-tRNA synthetase